MPSFTIQIKSGYLLITFVKKIHNHTPGYSTEVDSMTADIANMSLTPNLDSYVYFPQSKNIYKITSDKVIKLNSFPRL